MFDAHQPSAIGGVAHGEKGGGEGSELLHDASIESMIAAPKGWRPNPSTTSCVRVSGNSMSPLIHDGYILAVDSAQTEINELNGKIVIAWHRDRGLTVSRLNRFDHTIVLQSENSNCESITLSGNQKWKIVPRCSGGLENRRELLSCWILFMPRIDWLYPTLESKVVKSIHILPPRPVSATALVHKT
jgi:hypothetical protein